MTTYADTGWIQPVDVSGSIPAKKRRNRQSGTAWTRSGCITCKRRRKGCDKAKPSCNNCVKQGRTCEGYGDLWVQPLGPSALVFKQPQPDGSKRRRLSIATPTQLLSPAPSPGSESRFQVQPSPSVVSPSLSALSSPRRQIIDLEDEDSIRDQGVDSPKPASTFTQLDILADIPPSHSFISHLGDSETHYLQYHVEHGSRLLANLESADNPLRSLLIPRAIASPILMKAVCAVSALHLANRSAGASAQTAAATFYGRTLSGIRAAIADSSTDTLSDDDMLAVGLLCKYEVVRGSVKQWVVHLNALQRLIASRGGLAAMDPDAAGFLRGLYVYAYNMARISNRKRITSSENFSTDTHLGPPRLDIYIGYTEDILTLCARIAELPSLQDDSVSLRLAIASMYVTLNYNNETSTNKQSFPPRNDSLLTWSHTNTNYIIPQGLTSATLNRLQLVAECFRDAAFIYLHSILERMAMQPTPTKDTFDPDEWTSLISIPKSTAVDRCLLRIESFHLDDHCEYSALTFPLFISGCESHDFEHRDLVVESLSKLQSNFGIGNTKRAKDVLKLLWARRDAYNEDPFTTGVEKVHWFDVLEELQWDLTLA
ncbi:hypothetical protein N7532_011151 [Penicillium argentinense]|uniref:Zn(2)-C6 fungal-type domain-containing protein n=1 Tax=Penicillium argentinense TaxID=1131581 RepID=A0A9W9JUI3_9EURO|nr:uncharacterized protein N7532_011151 [Penicillium argentinense]KAJ5082108.1 hypothetical protein N7532_011151 [Penicillium argentinense]